MCFNPAPLALFLSSSCVPSPPPKKGSCTLSDPLQQRSSPQPSIRSWINDAWSRSTLCLDTSVEHFVVHVHTGSSSLLLMLLREGRGEHSLLSSSLGLAIPFQLGAHWRINSASGTDQINWSHQHAQASSVHWVQLHSCVPLLIHRQSCGSPSDMRALTFNSHPNHILPLPKKGPDHPAERPFWSVPFIQFALHIMPCLHRPLKFRLDRVSTCCSLHGSLSAN